MDKDAAKLLRDRLEATAARLEKQVSECAADRSSKAQLEQTRRMLQSLDRNKPPTEEEIAAYSAKQTKGCVLLFAIGLFAAIGAVVWFFWSCTHARWN